MHVVHTPFSSPGRMDKALRLARVSGLDVPAYQGFGNTLAFDTESDFKIGLPGPLGWITPDLTLPQLISLAQAIATLAPLVFDADTMDSITLEEHIEGYGYDPTILTPSVLSSYSSFIKDNGLAELLSTEERGEISAMVYDFSFSPFSGFKSELSGNELKAQKMKSKTQNRRLKAKQQAKQLKNDLKMAKLQASSEAQRTAIDFELKKIEAQERSEQRADNRALLEAAQQTAQLLAVNPAAAQSPVMQHLLAGMFGLPLMESTTQEEDVFDILGGEDQSSTEFAETEINEDGLVMDSEPDCVACMVYDDSRPGASFFDDPVNAEGEFYRSQLVRAQLKPLPGGIHGQTNLSRRPFEITLNSRSSAGRLGITFVHEALHVMDQLFKGGLGHDKLHAMAVFLTTEVLPGYEQLQRELAA